MRSWLFRNHLRLRAIYTPRLAPDTESLLPRSMAEDQAGMAPGECARVGRWFVLRPQPSSAA